MIYKVIAIMSNLLKNIYLSYVKIELFESEMLCEIRLNVYVMQRTEK